MLKIKNCLILCGGEGTRIKNFIQNPTQSINTQNSVIKILTEKLGFSKNLKNFFLLLVEKRRIFFVKKIWNSF